MNGWVNNREACDLRRYRAHYDVIVMPFVHFPETNFAMTVFCCHVYFSLSFFHPDKHISHGFHPDQGEGY